MAKAGAKPEQTLVAGATRLAGLTHKARATHIFATSQAATNKKKRAPLNAGAQLSINGFLFSPSTQSLT